MKTSKMYSKNFKTKEDAKKFAAMLDKNKEVASIWESFKPACGCFVVEYCYVRE